MHQKSKNKLIILIIFLLFAIPVLVAYLLGSGLVDFEPSSTKNHGLFISPPIKVADYTEADWVNELTDHWTLIYRTAEVCDEACLNWENKLHRYNLTLAQNADKLELMVLAEEFNNREEDPYQHITKVTTKGEKVLNDMFNDLSTQSLGSGSGLYVVAPEGYLMMAFTRDNKPEDIIKDLKLLVKRKG
ncbi:hypothetical protein [Marinicella gelatinilytica]|uniref:hypothetical protein n=1 Tax=Marinicella gelatinilytica TaxID=2996017 RepID=UPI0022608587|nr:hypothetical protein [Marinicella gelatinilytica]MCX7544956.1 hypothetical protein [Marinicella gelatinilytica]